MASSQEKLFNDLLKLEELPFTNKSFDTFCDFLEAMSLVIGSSAPRLVALQSLVCTENVRDFLTSYFLREPELLFFVQSIVYLCYFTLGLG
jgi:hypothetical protein